MTDTKHITIPYKPRNWAKPFHESLKRFSALVLHRRAGKTTAVMNHHQRACLDDGWERARFLHLRPELTESQLEELLHPPGGRLYGHVLPQHNQAKLVVWSKLKYYAEVIPGVRFNEAELRVRYPNRNQIQLFGADNPDSLRGPGFSGLSFDEYSQMPQNLFSEVLSKALGDHLGYAIFCGTIKGKDHLYRTYEAFNESETNFALWQDVDKSLASEDGITVQLLETAMADDRKLIAQGLMTQDEYDQEWFLSTEAAIKGAFYRDQMYQALKDGRITNVPYDPSLPVDTDWDLGMVDAMSVVFSQTVRGGQVRIIDYYEAEGEALPHFIKILREKGYTYGKHYPPWDATIKELGSGKSRVEVARDLGLRFEWPEKNPGVSAGIDAARLLIPRCWFDQKKAAGLIECLRHYRKAFNARLDTYTGTPVHDAFSHGADAFRGLAVRSRVEAEKSQSKRGVPMDANWSWS